MGFELQPASVRAEYRDALAREAHARHASGQSVAEISEYMEVSRSLAALLVATGRQEAVGAMAEYDSLFLLPTRVEQKRAAPEPAAAAAAAPPSTQDTRTLSELVASDNRERAASRRRVALRVARAFASGAAVVVAAAWLNLDAAVTPLLFLVAYHRRAYLRVVIVWAVYGFVRAQSEFNKLEPPAPKEPTAPTAAALAPCDYCLTPPYMHGERPCDPAADEPGEGFIEIVDNVFGSPGSRLLVCRHRFPVASLGALAGCDTDMSLVGFYDFFVASVRGYVRPGRPRSDAGHWFVPTKEERALIPEHHRLRVARALREHARTGDTEIFL